jgi:hypothetical protein
VGSEGWKCKGSYVSFISLYNIIKLKRGLKFQRYECTRSRCFTLKEHLRGGCQHCSRGDIQQEFANKVREMFTDTQLPVRQAWGWGRGEARIPPAAPTPLTLPYTLLYICTVQELCSRTVGEYRLRSTNRIVSWPAVNIHVRNSCCTCPSLTKCP